MADIKIINDPKDIGSIIQEKRKQLKMTQAEAAAMCNIGTRFLSELENGKTTLQIGKVLQVLKNFGFTIQLKRKEIKDV